MRNQEGLLGFWLVQLGEMRMIRGGSLWRVGRKGLIGLMLDLGGV